MRAMHDMAELVQHSIGDFFERHELPLVRRISKAEADSLALVDIEAQEIALLRVEFGQNTDSPSSLPHDRLDERRDLLEHV